MSDAPAESPTPLDLSDLRLTPQWVADFGKQQPVRSYADTDGGDRPRRHRDDRGGGGGGGRPPDRRGPPRSDSRDGPRRPGPGGGGGGFRGPPSGDRRRDGSGPRRRDDDRDQRPPRPEAPPVVTGLTIFIEPEGRAVEAMAQMIRAAGKAFSVFDAAKLVLASNDRFAIKYSLSQESGAKLHTVPSDGSLWLTRDEAVAHLLQSDVLQQYYKTENVELEEPKGNFTSIAVCGFSGEALGPPNHHSYQTALHKLHRERFQHIHFDDYKRRVHTESTPEAVEKWKESQKHGTQWIDLKAEVPEGGEPPRFKTRLEMENHFRTHHAAALVGETTEATVAGNIPRKLLSAALFHPLRQAVEEARKHLLPLAQRLCSAFEQHGLKLFKRRGGKLWVSRTRPRLLDSHVALSDRIAKIVELIKQKPGIPVKDLLHVVAPQAEAEKPAAAPVPSTSTAAAKISEVPAPAPVAEVTETATPETTAPPAVAPAPAPVVAGPPDERVQALKDLHWLNSEGYIIEYSDGVVFIGVTEPPPAKPKPVKETPPAPQKAVAAAKSESPAAEVSPAVDDAPPTTNAEEEHKDSEAPMATPGEDFMIDPEEEAETVEPVEAKAVEAKAAPAPPAIVATEPPEEDPPSAPEHGRHVD